MQEEQEASAGRGPLASEEAGRCVWVCGLPDVCSADTLEPFAIQRLGSAGVGDAAVGRAAVLKVVMSKHPGSAIIHMVDNAGAD